MPQAEQVKFDDLFRIKKKTVYREYRQTWVKTRLSVQPGQTNAKGAKAKPNETGKGPKT